MSCALKRRSEANATDPDSGSQGGIVRAAVMIAICRAWGRASA
jgi:hypothetical protein